MEEWKDIPNYEGLYQVSNEGRVRSLDRVVKRYDTTRHIFINQRYKGKIKVQRCTHFYLKVNLSKYGVFKTFNVHNLVALVFIGKRPKSMFIDHKDDNKHNNKSSNLEYITVLENNWNGSNWDGVKRNYEGGLWT